MADRSLMYLAIVVFFFSLAFSATGVFLPNYYLQIGLSVSQIVLLLAVLFLTLGLVPILTLKYLPKLFEKLLIAGLALNIAFFLLLATSKNPILLGLTFGLSWAAFWPAFNLLTYRLTNIKRRGIITVLLNVAIPSITSIAGPLLGGIQISMFGFNTLFAFGIVSLLVALVFSLRIKYAPAQGGFEVPRGRLLLLFGALIIIIGFNDPTFLAYPLLLNKLSGGFLQMGILASALTVIFAVVSLVANRITHAEKHRISFAFFGTLMSAFWLIGLAFVQNAFQIAGVSVFYGLFLAFGILLFSLFGDFFKRRQHASLVVLWEVFLMLGRLANLVPVSIFISSFDFKDYFLILGIVSFLCIIPFSALKLLHSKGEIAEDAAQ